jgi:thiamine biosynthesis lipoprotein
MKSVSSEVRRARPLLGTFVDITAQGGHEAKLHRAIDSAFAVVEKVHRLMSFHDPESDVSRINREAFHKPIHIHPWTWCVLKSARSFSRTSDGVFDITVARLLAKWNYLPRYHPKVSAGNWRDVVLQNNCIVRVRRRVIVDLGGIAKGFAVDRAIEALKRAGVSSGIVNAGGDLRVFGPTSHAIHLRNPAEPTLTSWLLRVRSRALATSALYFSRCNRHGPLINGQIGRALTDLFSVTVVAPDCMTADALTKIVFTLRENSVPLLKRHRADALLLERDGSPSWTFQSYAT